MPPNELSKVAQVLLKHGYNAEPEVVQFINNTPDPTSTIKFLISNISEEIFTLNMSHISNIYGESSPTQPSISILDDMTGNSTGSGTYNDFVSIFQDRLSQLSSILSNRINPYPLNSLKNTSGEVRVVGMVSNIQKTNSNHVLIELEDISGTFSILVNNNSDIFNLTDEILLDEVIGVKGKLSPDSEILFAEAIHFPDIPPNFNPPHANRPVQAALLSDIHVGSKNFSSDLWSDFTSWLKTPEAEPIEYILIAGDLVEGVGVYPGQDTDLEIINIYEQYEAFNECLKDISGDISMIMIPGNHDAVRLAEPQPGFDLEIKNILSSPNIHLTSNPSTVTIEEVPILMYHGVSLDEIIAETPSTQVSYATPHNAMIQLLKKRHLAPQFGSRTRISPEQKDYLVIDKIPSVFHSGHVHKFGYGKYHNVLVINSGCWQSQTDFQKRVNITPDVGYAPILDLDTLNLTIRKFS